MHFQLLNSTTRPWFHVIAGKPESIADALCVWEREALGNRIGRIVRGAKCQSPAELFDEWAAALQFPVTFGENWDAFADCMRDWSHVRDKSLIAIGVTQADQLLRDAAEKPQKTMAAALMMCAEDMNMPNRPRKPRPMHVIFQAPARHVESFLNRWRKYGLEIDDWT